MARDEQDREDLMKEATRLLPRSAWRVPGEKELVVLGIRSPASLSVYFGADPVYHFNSRGELRRGFVDGNLWVARGGRLVIMRRERGEQEVELLSRETDATEQQQHLDAMRLRLRNLEMAIFSGTAECVQTVGEDDVDRCRWQAALAAVARSGVADRPNVT